MRKLNFKSTRRANLKRQGMVLMIAVILLTVVAFSAFQLASWANSSLKIAIAIRQQIELRVALQSGVSQICLRLRQGIMFPGQADDEALSTCTVQAGTVNNPITVSACRPVSIDSNEKRVNGFTDESAKLDINWVAGLEEKSGRTLLMYVPGMTVQAADSILDWIDSDHDPRQFGAERNYYVSQHSQSLPPNAGISDLNELVAVRQVSFNQLFGTPPPDLNQTRPDSGGTGQLRRIQSLSQRVTQGALPWNSFLTVFAAEEDATRTQRIPLNSADLKMVYESVKEQMGEEEARYIIAVRMFGIKQRQVKSTATSQLQSLEARIQNQLGRNDPSADKKQTDPELKTLGGFDASGGPRWNVDSFYDLIGTFVIPTTGNGRHKVLRSPWQGDNETSAKLVVKISEVLSLAGEQPRQGRLNINEAPEELLRSLPDITDSHIKKLLSARRQRLRDAQFASCRTTEWLLTENVADIDLVRKWGPYITGRGDVLTADVFAASDSGHGPVLTCRLSLSAASDPPSVLYADSAHLVPAGVRTTLP